MVDEDAVGCGDGPHDLVLLVHLGALDCEAGGALEKNGAAAGDDAGLLATGQGCNGLELPVEDVGAGGEGIRVAPLELARWHNEEAAVRRPRRAAELAAILEVGQKQLVLAQLAGRRVNIAFL